MNMLSFITNSTSSLLAKEAGRSEERRLLENRIESRARDVTRQVNALAQSVFPGLWKDGDPIDGELNALLVTEARLRWLVRVAKYSEGANREALWLEVVKVLVQLERAAQALSHFEAA
jgi:hypothetical protein